MTVYCDYNIFLSDAGVECTSWYMRESLLAVGRSDSIVQVFTAEGELAGSQQRSCNSSALAWHPLQKMLCSGWTDGCITFALYVTDVGLQSVVREDREVHQGSKIILLRFSPSGRSCVSVDEGGIVAVWRCEGGYIAQEASLRPMGSSPHGPVMMNGIEKTGGLQGPGMSSGSMEPTQQHQRGGNEPGGVRNDPRVTMLVSYRKSGHVGGGTYPTCLVFRTAGVNEFTSSRPAGGGSSSMYPPSGGGAQHPPGAASSTSTSMQTQQDRGALNSGMLPSSAAQDYPSFFFAGESGAVFCADDFGMCAERYRIKSPVLVLEYFADKDMVVIITLSTIFVTFTVGADNEVKNETKVKLSLGPQPETLRATWCGPGLLATVSNEPIVRIWNVEGENHILSLADLDPRLSGDKAVSVDYNFRKRLLVVGTSQGRVLPWRSNWTPVSDEDWQSLPMIIANESTQTRTTSWGPDGLLLVVRDKFCCILSETKLCFAMSRPLIVAQVTHCKVVIHDLSNLGMSYCEVKFRVKGVSVSPPCLALWGGKQVQIFEYDESSMTFPHHALIERAHIACAAISCSSHERIAFIATKSKVELCNFQGSVKKTIQFSAEVEGAPIFLDVCDAVLCVATSKNLIRLWNVNRSTPKALNSGRKLEAEDITFIKLNCDGSRVGILLDGDPASTKLVLYDVDSDQFLYYECGPHRIPTAISWEATDPRLFMCATLPFVTDRSVESDKSGDLDTTLTLFADGSERILLQEEIQNPRDEKNVSLLTVGILVPRVYFFQKPGDDTSLDNPIQRTVLRDFVGLAQNDDPAVQKAVLNFSYHLACGNTDDAYCSVRSVLTSTQVWKNLALMCVKTRRLDVAMKCLGQMSNARAVKALRICEEMDTEPRLGLVALHLGMLEDAEEIFKGCKRYDLLNKMYQSTGQWDKALELVETEDRIHLKRTHYMYAQFCEAKGELSNALQHYEVAGCARTECPQLLCQMGRTEDLENYINHNQDPQLHRWYAQFLESKGNLDGAATEYRKAEDVLSLCRIHCYKQETQKARQLCEETGDAAASYHLARHLEGLGEIKEAMHFFSIAGRVNHALRLAQEHKMDNDIMGLALNSTPANMVKTAKMYEQREQYSQAVVLYQKAGYQTRALELCFQARLFDALCHIADELNAEADPEILAKCAEFFMQHSQHAKAVHLLSISHQYEKAINLCFEHNVKITEEMAEMMSPAKSPTCDEEERNQLLFKVGKLCKQQGLFQLACKMYTQAGDKVKAMKTLLKSGDTEKIIFFAGTARQTDIYVLAANYLQSLDARHNDPNVMKNIIRFYTKAKAYSQLSGFYESCAQVEIDEYRDYEKGAAALRESMKFFIKGCGSAYNEGTPSLQVDDFKRRIDMYEQFAKARSIAATKTNLNQVILICKELLDAPDAERVLRFGDVFAQMVEVYVQLQNWELAYPILQQMEKRRIDFTPYLDKDTIAKVCRQAGAPNMAEKHEAARPARDRGGQGHVSDEDEMGEEIEESMASDQD